MTPDDENLIDLLAAHRPYGIDCACGRPINSDRDWARHLAQMLALTAEYGATCDQWNNGRMIRKTLAAAEQDAVKAVARRHGIEQPPPPEPGDMRIEARLVGPWHEVTE